MADASLVVTAGSGTNIHTDTRSYSGTTKHDQYILPAEYDLASYVLTTPLVSIATVNDHTLELMAGSSLNVRIRRIRIKQAGNATTATVTGFQVLRLTTAGTGGTAITPAKMDTADSAAGATGMTLPSAKGTESTVLDASYILIRQAIATTSQGGDDIYEWVQHPSMKPIIIAAGTSNGIAIKNITAVTSASVTVRIEFVETNFV